MELDIVNLEFNLKIYIELDFEDIKFYKTRYPQNQVSKIGASRTVYPQGFYPETNRCLRRVGPRKGKALTHEIIFKVQVAGLELGSTPSQAQYKHLETNSPTNSANPLGSPKYSLQMVVGI